MVAAIGVDDLARDAFGGIAQKEARHLGDLLGPENTARGALAVHVAVGRLRVVARHVGERDPGGHGVHANAERVHPPGSSSHEAVHGGLGHAVGDVVGLLARLARDHEELAGGLLLALLATEELAAQEVRAAHVGPELSIEALDGHVVEAVLVEAHAGVAHQAVDAAAELGLARVQELAGALGLGDVRDHVGRGVAELLAGLPEGGLLAAGHHDLGALGDELLGHGEPEAAAAACDDDRLAPEHATRAHLRDLDVHELLGRRRQDELRRLAHDSLEPHVTTS